VLLPGHFGGKVFTPLCKTYYIWKLLDSARLVGIRAGKAWIWEILGGIRKGENDWVTLMKVSYNKTVAKPLNFIRPICFVISG